MSSTLEEIIEEPIKGEIEQLETLSEIVNKTDDKETVVGKELETTISSLKEVVDKDDEIKIKLGDVIKISSPADEELNEKICYINYIDNERLKLLIDNDDDDDVIEKELHFKEDGSFQNESITGIIILSRSETASYARQNGLVPGVWIDIHFNIDVPVIFTGKITNLEEDMIEIQSVNNEIIYIDFEYKGLIESKKIEKINIRNAPEELQDPSISQETDDVVSDDVDGDVVLDKTNLRTKIIKDTELIFGDDIEDITEIIDVKSADRRFSIEKQTEDLLNELLSDIPTLERTKAKLNKIHLLIERYKQLRTKFSIFDKYNNVTQTKIKGAEYKPLVEEMIDLQKELYWFIPVTKTTKKIYDVDPELSSELIDVEMKTTEMSLLEMQDIINNFLLNETPDGENNYKYLIRSLYSSITPYAEPNTTNYLKKLEAKRNICSVVNNLDDFNSTAICDENIGHKQFYVQNYNAGHDITKVVKLPSGDKQVLLEKLVSGDKLLLKSFLMLPMPFIYLSHVKLPKTNILIKSNLSNHFELYSNIFKKLSVNSIPVDDLSKPIEHDERGMYEEIREYYPDEELFTEDNEEILPQFLNTIIPKTRTLFNLIKPYINKLSFAELLSKLEPFLIYHDDITYKQYDDMNKFINQKILDYKKNFSIKSKEYNQLANAVRSNKIEPAIINILNQDMAIKEIIINGYGLEELLSKTVSNSELLSHTQKIDNSRLLYLGITLINKDLLISDGIDMLTNMKNNIPEDNTEDECKKYVLSKKYLDILSLENDNNNEIYYDSKYDPTFYGLLFDYNEEIETRIHQNNDIDPETIKFNTLKELLKTNIGLNDKDAIFEAETIISGKRMVRENDYCVLEQPDSKIYYKRTEGRWIKDEKITELMKDEDEDSLCNINEKCFKVNKQCVDNNSLLKKLEKDDIDNMLNEFDNKLTVNIAEYHKKIKLQFDIANNNIQFYKQNYFSQNNLFKYNVVNDEESVISSPYEGLRDMILGQEDFSKRHDDIIQFVLTCTKETSEKHKDDVDHNHWLYCNTTDVKLLPRFLYKLASVYVEGGSYIEELYKICKEQGTMSDDGDAWVDKYSGYKITNIEFDTEEGYTEAGFKMISREILEKDLGDTIIQDDDNSLETYQSVNGQIILNIIKTLSGYIGINIENSHDFIVRGTLHSISKEMPSEQVYNERVKQMAQKGKKQPSYEDSYNSILICLTICYMLIAIQTAIPSINTRKTHPGCKKGTLFMNKGYPMSGTEDKSGLIYLVCIANNIKSRIQPWNSIMKLNETALIKRVTTLMDKILKINTEIKVLIKNKKVPPSYMINKKYYQNLNIKKIIL